MRNNGNNPFMVPISKSGPTNEDIHKFIEEFTDRYLIRMCMGEDLRYVYQYELEALCEGVEVFLLDREYENSAYLSIVVKERNEDRLIVKYEGELYEVFDFFIDEDGVETLILSDIIWRANTMKTNN